VMLTLTVVLPEPVAENALARGAASLVRHLLRLSELDGGAVFWGMALMAVQVGNSMCSCVVCLFHRADQKMSSRGQGKKGIENSRLSHCSPLHVCECLDIECMSCCLEQSHCMSSAAAHRLAPTHSAVRYLTTCFVLTSRYAFPFVMDSSQ
jgi:hypothetical protein